MYIIAGAATQFFLHFQCAQIETVQVCFQKRHDKNWIINVMNINMPTSDYLFFLKRYGHYFSFSWCYPKTKFLCSLLPVLPTIHFFFLGNLSTSRYICHFSFKIQFLISKLHKKSHARIFLLYLSLTEVILCFTACCNMLYINNS